MRNRTLPRPALDAMPSAVSTSSSGGQNPFSGASHPYAPQQSSQQAGGAHDPRRLSLGDQGLAAWQSSLPTSFDADRQSVSSGSGTGSGVAFGSGPTARGGPLALSSSTAFAPQQSYAVSDSGGMLTLGSAYHVSSSGVHEFRTASSVSGALPTGSISKLGKDAATAYRLGVQASGGSALRCRHIDELDFDNGVQIGRGSSGRVYNVLHVPTGLRVCVKQMMIDDARHRDEVKRELDSLHKAPSEFVVDFFGAFFHNDLGVIFLVLELMEGSLHAALQVKGRLTERQCKAFAVQVVRGLQVLHSDCHVIHRDIKPANLLYHRGGHVKITDFGVSTGQRSQDPASVQTFVGSILYMSPERLEAKSYAYDSDLWSLGITLCEAATGHHPYEDESATPLTFWALLQKVMAADEERHKAPLRCSIQSIVAQRAVNPAPAPKPRDPGFGFGAAPVADESGWLPPVTQADVSDSFDDFVACCLRFDRTERATTDALLLHEWLRDMSVEEARRVVQELAAEVVLLKEQQQATAQAAAAAATASGGANGNGSHPSGSASASAGRGFTVTNVATAPAPRSTAGGGSESGLGAGSQLGSMGSLHSAPAEVGQSAMFAPSQASRVAMTRGENSPGGTTPETRKHRGDALLNDLLLSASKKK